jgi:hypothetical protein
VGIAAEAEARIALMTGMHFQGGLEIRGSRIGCLEGWRGYGRVRRRLWVRGCGGGWDGLGSAGLCLRSLSYWWG